MVASSSGRWDDMVVGVEVDDCLIELESGLMVVDGWRGWWVNRGVEGIDGFCETMVCRSVVCCACLCMLER